MTLQHIPLEGGPFLKAIHVGAQIFIEQPGINNIQIMYFNNPKLHTYNFIHMFYS